MNRFFNFFSFKFSLNFQKLKINLPKKMSRKNNRKKKKAYHEYLLKIEKRRA